ncbi:nucleosome assembly protein 1;2-like [Magnolia sinica]|uniref:nucleosome assembly protein 1;2-like n=1 Tax=Magnolia sinica TaxID=86752 RepID=UPI002659EE0E|nr:nucleosome assembly protein 1;2-like [Magnolia sinica]
MKATVERERKSKQRKWERKSHSSERMGIFVLKFQPCRFDHCIISYCHEFLKQIFVEFDLVPLASASLAKVHVAHMHDGKKVVVKSQHDELEAKFFEERAALEAKYQKMYDPLYAKVTFCVALGIEGTPTKDKATEEKGVPDFWLTAMKTNEVVGEEIFERDEGALKYLKDIKWFRINDPKGFKLEFFFDPNPYFKNTVLTKTYHMIDDDEPILEKAIGTEIEWYLGKSLTQKVLKKKPKKGLKNAKPITKTEQCDSFFNFFNPPQVSDDDYDIDEETVTSEYQAKEERMIAYLQKAWEFMSKFPRCDVNLIPRSENSKEDTLAKVATMAEDDIPRSIPIEFLAEPSINKSDSDTIIPVNSAPKLDGLDSRISLERRAI